MRYRVIETQTGRTGTISQENFDPARFKLIGQVSDTAPQPTPQSPQLMTGSSTTPQMVGGSSDTLRKFLGLMALSKSKSTSDISTSYNLLAPPKPTAKPQILAKAVNDYNSITGFLDDAVGYAESLRGKTGRLTGLLTGIQAAVGAAPDVKNFQDFAGIYASNMARSIGRETGVLTDADRTVAQRALPSLQDTTAELNGKISKLQKVKDRMRTNLKRAYSFQRVLFNEQDLAGGPEPTDQNSQGNGFSNFNDIMSIF